MERIPVFIDFDHTLFRADIFRALLFKTFLDAGYDEDMIKATYNSRDPRFTYSPERQLETLSSLNPAGDRIRAKRELATVYAHTPSMLHEGALELLRAIDRTTYSPIILTLGNPAYQEKKVGASGLAQEVERTVYCQQEKWDFIATLVEPNDRFLLIDDRNDAIAMTVRAFRHAHGILVDRTNLERNARYARVSIVHSLAEAATLRLPAGFPPLVPNSGAQRP